MSRFELDRVIRIRRECHEVRVRVTSDGHGVSPERINSVEFFRWPHAEPAVMTLERDRSPTSLTVTSPGTAYVTKFFYPPGSLGAGSTRTVPIIPPSKCCKM